MFGFAPGEVLKTLKEQAVCFNMHKKCVPIKVSNHQITCKSTPQNLQVLRLGYFVLLLYRVLLSYTGNSFQSSIFCVTQYGSLQAMVYNYNSFWRQGLVITPTFFWHEKSRQS